MRHVSRTGDPDADEPTDLKWVYGGGVAAWLLLIPAFLLLLGKTKLIAYAALAGAMVTIYPRLLSRALDSGTSFSLDLPKYPSTVELKTRKPRRLPDNGS